MRYLAAVVHHLRRNICHPAIRHSQPMIFVADNRSGSASDKAAGGWMTTMIAVATATQTVPILIYAGNCVAAFLGFCRNLCSDLDMLARSA